MYCNKCGNEILGNDKFCNKCGQVVEGNNEVIGNVNKKKQLHKIIISIILILLLIPISTLVVYPKIKPIIENQNKKKLSNDEIKSIYDSANKQMEQTANEMTLFLLGAEMGGKTRTVSDLKLVETFEETNIKLEQIYKQMDSFKVPSEMKEYHSSMIKLVKDTKQNIGNIVGLGKNNKNKLESEFVNENLSQFESCANAIKGFKDKYSNINTVLK